MVLYNLAEAELTWYMKETRQGFSRCLKSMVPRTLTTVVPGGGKGTSAVDPSLSTGSASHALTPR